MGIELMTEVRAIYTADRPTHKLAIALADDVDDDQVAGFFAGLVIATP